MTPEEVRAQRLSAQRVKAENQERYLAGAEAGRQWADLCATPKEFRRLLQLAVWPLCDGAQGAVVEFWTETLGGDSGFHFRHGFVDGAIQVWDEVVARREMTAERLARLPLSAAGEYVDPFHTLDPKERRKRARYAQRLARETGTLYVSSATRRAFAESR